MTPTVRGSRWAASPSSLCLRWPIILSDGCALAGWQAPVDYSLASITSLLDIATIFPAAIRSRLPMARAALARFIATCAYSDGRLLDTDAFSTSRASACPPLPSAACVQGKAVQTWPSRTNTMSECASVCFQAHTTPRQTIQRAFHVSLAQMLHQSPLRYDSRGSLDKGPNATLTFCTYIACSVIMPRLLPAQPPSALKVNVS